MIVTVTLNPAIDKRLHVPQMKLGSVVRTSSQESTAGGKGLNVARVAHQLGEEVLATGMLGGMNGEWIRHRLDQDGMKHDFVTISGDTRICLNVIDDSNGISSEILEQGPTISETESAAMLEKIRQLAAPGVLMVMSGSLPSGLSSDYYSVLVQVAQKRGAKVLLDTSGAALIAGLKSGPYVVKPNEDEIVQLTGDTVKDEPSFRSMVPKLVSQGADNVIVSLGADGCLASIEGAIYRVKAPRIQAVNTVGSGDSFMAGLAVAWKRGLSGEEALRLATAAGAANALSHGTGHVTLEDVQRLQAEVVIDRL